MRWFASLTKWDSPRKGADSVIFMDKGSIAEEAIPVTFFNRPTTSRAKDLLSHILH